MKEIYLLYNSIKEEYYFSTASDPYGDRSRKTILEKNLLQEVKFLADPKRNSLLNLLNVKEDMAEKIEKMFDGSKITIQRKDK